MLQLMFNALSPITLTCGRHTLVGFSISGLATYVQVADLDVCFDMGECPLSAVPLGRSPINKPTITGTTALTIAVVGATTVIAPLDRAR